MSILYTTSLDTCELIRKRFTRFKRQNVTTHAGPARETVLEPRVILKMINLLPQLILSLGNPFKYSGTHPKNSILIPYYMYLKF